MEEPDKTPLRENTKDDSSDIERVKKDKEWLEKTDTPQAHHTGSAPPEPQRTKEDEEAEKGHS